MISDDAPVLNPEIAVRTFPFPHTPLKRRPSRPLMNPLTPKAQATVPSVPKKGSQSSDDDSNDDNSATGISDLVLEVQALTKKVADQDKLIKLLQETVSNLQLTSSTNNIRRDDPVIKEIQAQIQATGPKTFREALVDNVPELTNKICKEQSERIKRSRNIVIRDRAPNSPTSVIKSKETTETDIKKFLHDLGVQSEHTDYLTARTIVPKPITSTSANTTASSSNNNSSLTIVTLPHLPDRTQLLIHLKKGILRNPNYSFIYVDYDYTPTESLIQQQLRLKRNQLNSQRSENDVQKFYYAIRNDAVVQISL
jgi:hypothetical protein